MRDLVPNRHQAIALFYEMRLPRTDPRDLNDRCFGCPYRMNRPSGIHIIITRTKLFCLLTCSVRSKGNSHYSLQNGYPFLFGMRMGRHDKAFTESETHRKEIGTLGVSF